MAQIQEGIPGNEFPDRMHCITPFHWSCCSNTNGLHTDLIPVLHMLKKEGSRKCVWNVTFLEHVFAHDSGLKKFKKNRDEGIHIYSKATWRLGSQSVPAGWEFASEINEFFPSMFTVAPTICIFCAVNVSRIASGLEDLFLNFIFIVNVKWLLEVEIRISVIY